MILKQLKNGEAKIENQYARLVKDTGNASALNPIATVFIFKSNAYPINRFNPSHIDVPVLIQDMDISASNARYFSRIH
jgi:hydrogenase maturation factor